MGILRILDLFLNFLFPRRCVGCFIEGTDICESCAEKINYIQIQVCPGCRRKNGTGKFCDRCASREYFDQLLVCINYDRGGIFKKLIVRFKYKFSQNLSGFLGKMLKEKFSSFDFVAEEFLIVPVPLHPKRLKSRGFNQAEILAKYIDSNIFDILIRKIYQPPQAKLHREGRLNNLKGAFCVSEKAEIRGKRILLVDDVATTGSTISECSKVLKAAGATYVCGLVLARGR